MKTTQKGQRAPAVSDASLRHKANQVSLDKSHPYVDNPFLY